MITLNLQNTEELIFYNSEIIKLFPEFKDLFNSWKLGITIPALKFMSKKAILDFLNEISSEQIKILENYFNSLVKIVKIDYNIVKNYEFNKNELENELVLVDNNINFCVSMDEDKIYMTLWR